MLDERFYTSALVVFRGSVDSKAVRSWKMHEIYASECTTEERRRYKGKCSVWWCEYKEVSLWEIVVSSLRAQYHVPSNSVSLALSLSYFAIYPFGVVSWERKYASMFTLVLLPRHTGPGLFPVRLRWSRQKIRQKGKKLRCDDRVLNLSEKEGRRCKKQWKRRDTKIKCIRKTFDEFGASGLRNQRYQETSEKIWSSLLEFCNLGLRYWILDSEFWILNF